MQKKLVIITKDRMIRYGNNLLIGIALLIKLKGII